MNMIKTKVANLSKGALNYALSKCVGGQDKLKYSEEIKRTFVKCHMGDIVEIPLDVLELARYEGFADLTADSVEIMDENELYVLRVYQLESEGMTTSDAQGIADYEQERDEIQANAKRYMDKHKPAILMSEYDQQELAECALNAACLTIQTRLGVTDGGLAAIFFSGSEVKDRLTEYISSELAILREEIADKTAELLKANKLTGEEILQQFSTGKARTAQEWASEMVVRNPKNEPFSMWEHSQLGEYADITQQLADGKMVIEHGIAYEQY